MGRTHAHSEAFDLSRRSRRPSVPDRVQCCGGSSLASRRAANDPHLESRAHAWFACRCSAASASGFSRELPAPYHPRRGWVWIVLTPLIAMWYGHSHSSTRWRWIGLGAPIAAVTVAALLVYVTPPRAVVVTKTPTNGPYIRRLAATRPVIVIQPSTTFKFKVDKTFPDISKLRIINETDLPQTRPTTQNSSTSAQPCLKVYSFSSIESLDRYAATHPKIRQNGIYDTLKQSLESDQAQTRPTPHPAPSSLPATSPALGADTTPSAN